MIYGMSADNKAQGLGGGVAAPSAPKSAVGKEQFCTKAEFEAFKFTTEHNTAKLVEAFNTKILELEGRLRHLDTLAQAAQSQIDSQPS
jgi:hypothetical protein